MSRWFSTRGLARLSAHYPWQVIAGWIIIILLCFGLGVPNLGGVLSTEVELTNNADAAVGLDVIDESGLGDQSPISETIVIKSNTGVTVDDPAFQALTQQVTDEIRTMLAEWGNTDPQLIANYMELQAAGVPAEMLPVSADRTSTLINVPFPGDLEDEVEIVEFMDHIEALNSDEFTVATAGPLSVNEAFSIAAEEDIVTGEVIGVPISMIILGIVFGAIVAPFLPVSMGIAAIALSLAAVAIIGQFQTQQVFITNMITVLGLAVGIDYALFIVDRYREFRSNGAERREAIEFAGATASKAVVFSAGTVIFALAGLWLVPNTVFRSLGMGAVLVVAATVLVSLTLLPALLSVIGDRINWPRKGIVRTLNTHDATEADAYTGFWGRVTRIVMARPWVSLAVVGGFLIALAIPAFSLHTGFLSGAAGLPPGNVQQAVAILDEEFSAGAISPVRIVLEGDRAEIETVVANITAQINQNPNFLPVSEEVSWSENGSTALLVVTLASESSSDAALDAIRDIRANLIPAAIGDTNVEVYVTGESAANVDMLSGLDSSTPWVFAFVLTLSFLLLTIAFRSIVVPIKAIIMNLLSVGATYGLIVLVFQEGFLIDLFGFNRAPVIESWIPLMLFSVLFGLSMDYHVFLLSRIREHYDLTFRNRESVAIGLRTTARIITGAALIMVAVFAGMAAGQVTSFQQLGFGFAVAVLIDATLIRSVLVPASMTILDKWNWYLPSWLNWLPDIRIEGAVQQQESGDIAVQASAAD